MLLVIALPMALALAAATENVQRCGLALLPQGWKPSPPPLADSARASTARSLASGVQTLLTTHFAIFWTASGNNAVQTGGTRPDPRSAAAGDSVPALVRSAATGLEKAWSRYVDSLGYRKPHGVSISYLWQIAPPAGRYPVEICDVDSVYRGAGVFGITIPFTDGSSAMLLAANLPTFEKYAWSFPLDAAPATRVSSNYSRNWDTVMRATAAHELFHAVQFRYETGLDHFLFEASAVAMETRVVPEESDYLFYLNPSRGGLADVGDLVPLTASLSSNQLSLTYDHAWYVLQLLQDRGLSVLRSLWESRGGTNATIRTTLRSVLDQGSDSYDSSLARYALRVALSGRRSNWLAPWFSPFSDALLFPTLTNLVAASDSYRQIPLTGGAIRVWIDTATASAGSDRIVNWLPDAGASLRHAWKNGTTSGSEWARGPIRQDAAPRRQDAWAIANPGPQAALRSFATVDSASPALWTSTAPPRTQATAGTAFSWSSGAAILSGTPSADAACTPRLYLDLWEPSAGRDPTAAAVANRAGSHSAVLADADRTLSLAGTRLELPWGSMGAVLVDRGDGAWIQPKFESSASSTTVQLDALDLSIPLRVLAAPGPVPAGSVSLPRPNPSRHGTPIRFPVNGGAGGATLEILAQDGTAVRTFTVPDGANEVVWDVRTSSGKKVRPGMYWFVWRGIEGAVRGKILVAE